MIGQNVTINAAIIGAVAVVIGSMLGGLVATFFLHIMASKAEKRKNVRQRIEEIYILSTQLEEFSIMRAFDVSTLTPTQYEQKYILSGKYIFQTDSFIGKMNMIAVLYLPKLENHIKQYQQDINRANIRIETELEQEERNTAQLTEDSAYMDAAKSVTNDIREINKILRLALLAANPKR